MAEQELIKTLDALVALPKETEWVDLGKGKGISGIQEVGIVKRKAGKSVMLHIECVACTTTIEIKKYYARYI